MKAAVVIVHGETITEEYAAVFLANRINLVTVAYRTGEPIGLLISHLIDMADGGPRELFVYEIDVVEAERRKGIGSRLIAKTMEEASPLGAGNVFVITEESNISARRLYLSSGFTQSEKPAVGFEFTF